MIEDYLHTLADEKRRKLLLILLEQDAHDEIPVPEAVVEDEADLATLRIEFHHCHLPQLDDLGLVDWEQETETVTKGANLEQIRPLLESIDKIEQSPEENR